MLSPLSIDSALTQGSTAVLQFPSGTASTVRSLRNMTAQLLQEATKIIPNQQLLINVVSKRVRQLGTGHRPLVEATLKSSLTDIALKEIIAGKLTFEEVKEAAAKA
jgi:DNA-directed RNA polymerase subunit omega